MHMAYWLECWVSNHKIVSLIPGLVCVLRSKKILHIFSSFNCRNELEAISVFAFLLEDCYG